MSLSNLLNILYSLQYVTPINGRGIKKLGKYYGEKSGTTMLHHSF